MDQNGASVSNVLNVLNALWLRNMKSQWWFGAAVTCANFMLHLLRISLPPLLRRALWCILSILWLRLFANWQARAIEYTWQTMQWPYETSNHAQVRFSSVLNVWCRKMFEVFSKCFLFKLYIDGSHRVPGLCEPAPVASPLRWTAP